MLLMVGAAGCKKKIPVATAPPPAPASRETPPPPPAPRAAAASISSFTVEPRSIERGQAATLRWSITNATEMSLDQGLGVVQANGTRQVFPSNTTTYTLSARSAGGGDSKTVTVDVSAPPPPPPPSRIDTSISGSDMLTREAQDAYFDYDKSEVRDDGRTALTHDADLLKRIFAADPSFTVAIEGHCDERGSAEYNLGLGDRRATAAKEFLVQLGVPADRLTTISYGKDRPVCTDATEACYQRNRRAHLSPAK
jgi:peptidoglycan-associated lipoprotein